MPASRRDGHARMPRGVAHRLGDPRRARRGVRHAAGEGCARRMHHLARPAGDDPAIVAGESGCVGFAGLVACLADGRRAPRSASGRTRAFSSSTPREPPTPPSTARSWARPPRRSWHDRRIPAGSRGAAREARRHPVRQSGPCAGRRRRSGHRGLHRPLVRSPWLEAHRLERHAGRPSIVGVVRGAGRGRSLMFNGISIR